jgi:methylisocitrate lyase
MQTRAELYATIGYHEYESLDSSIITSVRPEGMPQRQPDR